MEVMLIVLFPDFSGELNSTIIGVAYLSFTNFISVAFLIMRSCMLVLCGVRFDEGFVDRVDIVIVIARMFFRWVHGLVIVCRCFREIYHYLL